VSSSLGWWRAAATAVAILAVGAGVFVYAPNWVLVHLTGLSRSGRVAVATTGFLVLLVAMAFVLRRLQRRRLI
jgi:hypothetical protein